MAGGAIRARVALRPVPNAPAPEPSVPRAPRRRGPIAGFSVVVAAFAATFGISSCGSKSSKASDTTVAAAATATSEATAPATDSAAPAESVASTPDTVAAPTDTVAAVTDTVTAAAADACPKVDGTSPQTKQFAAAPPMCIDATKTYKALVETNKGSFTITFDAKRAPITVNNFVSLARFHFFDGSGFHRVVPNFVIQGGSGDGQGRGGPGYTFQDELPQPGEYKIGSVAMANAGANTNDSQFFVITGSNGAALPPNYSLFGDVTEGMDTVNAIAALGTGDGPPSEPVAITKVTIDES